MSTRDSCSVEGRHLCKQIIIIQTINCLNKICNWWSICIDLSRIYLWMYGHMYLSSVLNTYKAFSTLPGTWGVIINSISMIWYYLEFPDFSLYFITCRENSAGTTCSAFITLMFVRLQPSMNLSDKTINHYVVNHYANTTVL